MWRDRVRAVLNWCSAICLTVLLLGLARLVAQPQSLVAECQEDSRKLAEQQSVVAADYDGLIRSEAKRRALHDTLRGYVARLNVNFEQSKEVIRAILVVLEQLKQANAEVRATWTKYGDALYSLTPLESEVSRCFVKLDQARGAGAGGAPIQSFVVTLTVLDRTETVNLSFSNGNWNITDRFQQGIKLPSHDPAASDVTAPVKVDRRVFAEARFVPSLPDGWTMTLGIWADSKTPPGPDLCNDQIFCRATSGPYPGVKRGFGKGWAAIEKAAVWVCRGRESCVGQGNPVALININWVLP